MAGIYIRTPEIKEKTRLGVKKAILEGRLPHLFVKGNTYINTGRTRFKKGDHKGYEYPKGHIPWSAGKKGLTLNTGRTHFKKGMIPWNKGIKRPEMTGKNHFAWKGGMYDKNRKIDMGRRKYRNWRKTVLKRDNYTCIQCGSMENLEADHIRSYISFSELRYDVPNGRTLCHDCHIQTETYGKHNILYQNML